MIWSTLDLSPSAVPQLQANERIVLSVGNVGLYDGETKSPDHTKGTVFLTSQRLMYVDGHHPILNSIQTDLDRITEVSYSPRFLKSSAKINIKLLPADDGGAGSRNNSKQSRWICTICSFSNVASAAKCENCGVLAQDDTSIYIDPAASASLSAGQCPQCTFQNHPSLPFCEMCGSSLKPTIPLIPTLGDNVKISFRSGESHKFFESLQRLVQSNADSNELTDFTGSLSRTPGSRVTSMEPSSEESSKEEEHGTASTSHPANTFGIRSIQARSQQMQTKSNAVLDKSLKSPKELKANLKEVVEIAERLGLSSSINKDVGFGDIVMHRSTLPIIVGVDGDSVESLARQLADLLIGKDDLLAHAGGMLTLHDVYSILNRCRGLGTVTPQQLLNALNQCERLDLPIRVRSLNSGLKVVESRGGLDQAIQRLIYWIGLETREYSWRESSGFSARDVCEKFGCSIQVALEELTLAEERGKLCRDEHTSGLRFFPNLFIAGEKAN